MLPSLSQLAESTARARRIQAQQLLRVSDTTPAKPPTTAKPEQREGKGDSSDSEPDAERDENTPLPLNSVLPNAITDEIFGSEQEQQEQEEDEAEDAARQEDEDYEDESKDVAQPSSKRFQPRRSHAHMPAFPSCGEQVLYSDFEHYCEPLDPAILQQSIADAQRGKNKRTRPSTEDMD